MIVPAGALVDDQTILQVDVETADYLHVELDTHDIVLAENLACESYLDMGDRAFFGDGGIVDLHASPDRLVFNHSDFRRPYVSGGPIVEAIRRRLRTRAATPDERRVRAA